MPFKRGAYRSATMLSATFGLPVRTVSGVRVELSPVSASDEYLASHMDSSTAIHAAMARWLEEGSVFLDVGANIGLFSVLAAASYGAEVYAFDPSERELARLRRNAALNGVRVEAFAVALGSEESVGSMQLNDSGHHLLNRILPGAGDGPGRTECSIRRLDRILSAATLRRVRLVKIDVEGYEMQVLAGMENALEHLKRAAFVIEVTPAWLEENGASADALYDFLASRGWKPRGAPRLEHQWDEIFEPAADAAA